jgi:hypothetical protein
MSKRGKKVVLSVATLVAAVYYLAGQSGSAGTRSGASASGADAVTFMGVNCDPDPLKLDHGEKGEITLRLASGYVDPDAWSVEKVEGRDWDKEAKQIKVDPESTKEKKWPAGHVIKVESTAVDGPDRTEQYDIEVKVKWANGSQTLWCFVGVIHREKKAPRGQTPDTHDGDDPESRYAQEPEGQSPRIHRNEETDHGSGERVWIDPMEREPEPRPEDDESDRDDDDQRGCVGVYPPPPGCEGEDGRESEQQVSGDS